MTKEKESKDAFKGVKEDGFWRTLFKSLAEHCDEIVQNKAKSKAAV